jgi:precorrin-6Y C5,15-methyltransferase (decarboxylating)
MRIEDQSMNREATSCTDRRWLSIVGLGEDGTGSLSDVAKRLIGNAELVVGGARHLALTRDLIRGEEMAWPSPIGDAWPKLQAMRGRPVVVLATGDPFFYGVGKQIAALFPAEEILCIPQPSAFSLAAARLGWPLQDTSLVSLHGRALEGIIRYLQPGARILALSWDGETPSRLARLLAERGMGASRLTVLEAMGGENERIRSAVASELTIKDVNALNTIAIEVDAGDGARVQGLASGLDDSFFENDGQLTKREVRALTLSSLAPRKGELLWDIGLGAGSIAIEWLLRDPAMRAIGIEENPERAARAARNAAALGVPDLRIVTGRAPEALAGLAAPDAVFIGGGMGDGVFDAAWSTLKPGGRLVANGVSIGTEARLAVLWERFGGELSRVGIARAESLGGMKGWRPAMPVTQWRVVKP